MWTKTDSSWNSWASAFLLLRLRRSSQRLARPACGVRLTMLGEHVDHLVQLLERQPDAHAGGHVRLQLWLHARRRSQRADRGKLAALPIQMVALEDVAKQVCA